jgi:hypothetical protein
MRIQSTLSTSVHAPLSASTHPSPPSKTFSEHVGAPRETGTARTVTAVGDSTESATVAQSTGTATVEAPSAASATASGTSGTTSSSVQSSLDQSQDQNLQYLQLQTQVNDQSETFTTLSNVMKTENDTLKNTAANMAM